MLHVLFTFSSGDKLDMKEKAQGQERLRRIKGGVLG